jgi:hypothetical protein
VLDGGRRGELVCRRQCVVVFLGGRISVTHL